MGPRRGSAAVEFAMTLPVLMLILSGIVEYGWFLTQASHVTHAVRDGVRMGVTKAKDDDAEPPDQAAINHTTELLNGAGIDCSVAACTFNSAIDQSSATVQLLTLTVAIEYEPVIGFVPAPDQLKGNFTMALEDQSEDE